MSRQSIFLLTTNSPSGFGRPSSVGALGLPSALRPGMLSILLTIVESYRLHAGVPHRALRSLIILIIWGLWNERNERVFQHHENSTIVLVAKIKEEARAWCIAGAKSLASFLLLP